MKSACEQYAGDLSAMVDGELPVQRQAEIEAHLTGCADCRARVEELRRLATGIAALPELTAPPGFLKDVRAKIARGNEPRTENWWEQTIQSPWVVVPMRLAAVLVLVWGLIALFAGNSHIDRVSHSELAKAKKPTERPVVKASADEDVTREIRAAPAPTAAAAQVPAAPPAATAARIATGQAEGTGVVETKNQPLSQRETEQEPIVVVASDVSQVQAQANQMALALNGRVTSTPAKQNVAQKMENSFYVEVPARNAVAFRNQLLNQYAPVNRLSLDWSQAANYQQSQFSRAPGTALPEKLKDAADSLSNEPISVLEIQVVPPAK
jgi:anti-sigma factor RsiW